MNDWTEFVDLWKTVGLRLSSTSLWWKVPLAYVTWRVLLFVGWALLFSREGLLFHLQKEAILFVKRTPVLRLVYQQQVAKMKASLRKNKSSEEGRPRVIPEHGVDKRELLQRMQDAKRQDCRWDQGKTFGFVYHGDEEHVKFLNEVYAMYSQTNPLHLTAFPSVQKMEQEVVRMTISMMHGDEHCCGSTTSGGTESLLLACKAYRDYARRTRGITDPEILLPRSAHAAFVKAGHYFGMTCRFFEVGPDGRADVADMRRKFNKRVVMVVGSAPSYPHGVIDPIPAMSAFALSKGVPMHVDGCLGGFMVPWVKRLEETGKLSTRQIPEFDFSLPGVTSISADLHKYGFSAKGASTIMYRSEEIMREQFSVFPDWSGGLYGSPTIMGSRPGALIATAWAALMYTGQDGFMETARKIKAATDELIRGINNVDGLRVISNPDVTVFAFESVDRNVDIFQVAEYFKTKDFHMERQQYPNAIHFTVTYQHTIPGVVERILKELRTAVEYIRAHPEEFAKGDAPMYGLAARLPDRSCIDDFISEALMNMLSF